MRSATATSAATRRGSPRTAPPRRPSPASSPRSAASSTTSSAPSAVGQNPADLVSSPKRDQKLPQVLSGEQVRTLLERIPARTPLELRDRAMLELAYSCGLRCEEIVKLDLGAFDFETEQLRVLGKGSKERLLPVGEPAQRALRRYLERGRPALADEPARAGAVPLQERPPPLQLRRHQASRPLGPRGGAGRRRLAALAAPQLRHPPARRRRGPAHDPGVTRPCVHLDDPGLHSRRRRPPAGCLPCNPSPGVMPICRRSAIESSKAMETGVKEVELRDLWRRYKEEDDQSARERLVVAYSPMVKFVAGRLGAGLPSHVDDADLISYGLMGLIGAIERFEPERGIKFETFAMTRIRGAIIDELRSLDWVPRSVRARGPRNRGGPGQARARAAAGADRGRAGRQARHQRGELQTSLLEIANSSVYALDELWTVSDSSGDTGLAARHDLRPPRRRPAGVARQQRDQGPPDRGDRLAARARAARRRPLLLREPDPARDRRGPRRDRVARLAAAHQGGDAVEVGLQVLSQRSVSFGCPRLRAS